MEVDALTPARRRAKGDVKGSGKKGSGKTQRKSGDDQSWQDVLRVWQDGTLREGLLEPPRII